MTMRTHVETPLLVAALAGEPDAFAVFSTDGTHAALVAVSGNELLRFTNFEIGADLRGVDIEFIAA